ncbi:hypothetical protein Tco_0554790 [Tanacetum coccineum]
MLKPQRPYSLEPPLQEFDIEIKDKKGIEIVAADQLSRIEKEETSNDTEVDDNFPRETLMEINTKDDPWFADFANYLEEPNLFKVCSDGSLEDIPSSNKAKIKYLKVTLSLGLWYPKCSDFDIKGYLDSNYAGCNMDRKSTSGAWHVLGDKLVCGSAKKQQSVAMSSAKAEYKVLIFCDNTSAIAISNNPVLHSRTKHIDIIYHFIRDHILKIDIKLHFIPTQYQLADIFTKPLDELTFKRLIVELGMIFNEFNRLSGINDDLFTYEIEYPQPTPYDEQRTSNPTHNDLGEYEWKMSYEECEKIYAEAVIFIDKRLVRLIDVTVEQWLDLKYGDHKTMDKNVKKEVIGTWLIISYKLQFEEYLEIKKQRVTYARKVDMEYNPSNLVFAKWLASKFYNHLDMDWYTKNALWVYCMRGNDEVVLSNKEDSDLKDENNNDEHEIAEVFRIETKLFDYKTPLCAKFNEFNYLLKVDPKLFTHDIQRTKTYEDYENKLNNEVDEPWSKDGVPYEMCDHICEPFHFKDGKAKWSTCNSNEDGWIL